MIIFTFTKYAKRQFQKLEILAQKNIQNKLKKFKDPQNLAQNIQRVYALDPVTHRIRINRYRLLVEKQDNHHYLVLKIGHRKDVYH